MNIKNLIIAGFLFLSLSATAVAKTDDGDKEIPNDFIMMTYPEEQTISDMYFTRITCVSEMNYFDASSMVFKASDKDRDVSRDQIRNKYNLRHEILGDAQKCKLNDVNLKIQIVRNQEREICDPPRPGSIMKFWIDDKLAVELDSFDIGEEPISITGIGFKTFKEDWYKQSVLYFHELYGGSQSRICEIWLDEKMKNITSNNCNLLKNYKSLPIIQKKTPPQ